MRLNRDVYVGIALLLICAVFLNATFDIQSPLFGQMSSALWPRIILTPLTFLSLIYVIRSMRLTEPVWEQRGSLANWFAYYKNPICCFILFFVFLLTLPYLGMLIGGIIFVFAMLTFLGGWQPKQLITHALVSAVFVGAMWAIFTFVLGVILPQGEILQLM
ncbi:MAG: tripartite tricarboxylate transporter TctB family protein [Sneathiella sp.]